MKIHPSDAESIGEEIARFMESHGVRSERGNPREYFGRMLSHVSAGLTLPIVPADKLRTVVLLKCYYSLWNNVVDDEMDRQPGTRHELDASIKLLLQHTRQEPEPIPETNGARVLNEILTRLPTEAAKQPLRQLFYFDMWELMNGFSFEYCINKVPWAANAVEYRKHSTVTASIKHFLDLDCLFADKPLAPDTYRHLRVGYEHFGTAIKFASDVGSLQRELLDEDNLNIIRILARDWDWESGELELKPELKHKLKLEGKLENEAAYESLRPYINLLVKEVHQQAKASLDTATGQLTKAASEEPGSPPVDELLKSVTRVFDNYLQRDPFFKKTK